ncbi:extracellular solute-binding protein [Paenibacillus rhizoplanae]
MLKDYKTFFLGGSLIIFKSTKHPKEAWEFSKFLTDPQNVLELHQGLWMPQMKQWYEDPKLVDSWANEELPGRPAGFRMPLCVPPTNMQSLHLRIISVTS